MTNEKRVVQKPFTGIDGTGAIVRLRPGAALFAPPCPDGEAPEEREVEVLCMRCGKIVRVFCSDLDQATD